MPSGGRCLYMLNDVFDRFENKPWPTAEWERPQLTRDRRRAMRMVVERFVKGENINLRYDLKELGSDKVINANMKGYWEFRSGPPNEQTRLFGFFARPGAFVATEFALRGDYVDNADWRAQRQACQKQWEQLTSEAYLAEPWPVLTGADLAEYLERDDD